MMKWAYRKILILLAAMAAGSTLSACTLLGARYVTITYDTAGLTQEESYEGMSGSSFRLPVLVNDEYAFDGWYYDAAFTQKCGKIISLDRSRTIYAKWTKASDEWAFSPIAEETAFKVTSYSGTDAYITIPSEYEGRPVTAIGGQFLGKHATKVHGIFIPDTITEIEDYAFYNTAYLEEIEIPASVTKLGSRVFAVDAVNTVLRKYVYINGTPSVKKDTFYDQTWSFQIASVVANPNSAAYKLFLQQKSYNAGVIDATGIDAYATPSAQYAAHLKQGAEHELEYDSLPARPAVNASMILNNLRFGYRSVCEPGSVAARVLDSAREVLYEIIDADMSEYEKVHAVYDWVTAAVTYDHAVIEEDILDTWLDASYNLEGVFLNRTAVCDGIAKSVELLLGMEGIECVRVIGESGGGGHAWNKVKLDGEWYLLDATFGDCEITRDVDHKAIQATGEFTDHAMMLGTDDVYHTPDPPFQSGYEATDRTLNYFTAHTYGNGNDLQLDSTKETRAFVSEFADSLREGEVVNFTTSYSGLPLAQFLLTLKTELASNGLSSAKILESNNGSYFIMPASAQAIAV